jgi:hypothetical protein
MAMTRPAWVLACLFLVSPGFGGENEPLDRFFEKSAKRIARVCEKGKIRALLVTTRSPLTGSEGAVDRELAAKLMASLMALRKRPACVTSTAAPDVTLIVGHQEHAGRLLIGLRMSDGLLSDSILVDNTFARAQEARWRVSAHCADAPERVDDLQRSIIELKARYWAGRLRRGYTTAEGRQRPGEMITDRGLARQFESSLRRWLSAKRVPSLDHEEANWMMTVDSDAYRIYRACRVQPDAGHLASAD